MVGDAVVYDIAGTHPCYKLSQPAQSTMNSHLSSVIWAPNSRSGTDSAHEHTDRLWRCISNPNLDVGTEEMRLTSDPFWQQ
uniref:Uncharacterized protein n=1 Tax=Physcomitrium patens TaxID=3218 RepID=A0A2K1JTK4_PHYPA|nr:hypothetical protein PHYPA_014631 [Physcomitrium patens]